MAGDDQLREPIFIPAPGEPAAHVEEGVGAEWDIRLKNPNWRRAILDRMVEQAIADGSYDKIYWPEE